MFQLLSALVLFCFASPPAKVNKHASSRRTSLACAGSFCCAAAVINSIFASLPPPAETWVWLAALTVPSAWLRRPSARMTSLRSRKVSTGWRRGWLSSGIKLWWGLVSFLYYFHLDSFSFFVILSSPQLCFKLLIGAVKSTDSLSFVVSKFCKLASFPGVLSIFFTYFSYIPAILPVSLLSPPPPFLISSFFYHHIHLLLPSFVLCLVSPSLHQYVGISRSPVEALDC